MRLELSRHVVASIMFLGVTDASARVTSKNACNLIKVQANACQYKCDDLYHRCRIGCLRAYLTDESKVQACNADCSNERAVCLSRC